MPGIVLAETVMFITYEKYGYQSFSPKLVLMCVPVPGTFNPPGEHVPCHEARFFMYTFYNPPPPTIHVDPY